MSVPLDTPAVGSARWWVDRLYAQLRDRQAEQEFFSRYVDGDHDDPTVEQKASRAFRRILGLSKTNLSGLIVEATAERLTPTGFRFGDNPDGDRDAWRIWQGSDFDAESELLITSALTVGRSFVLVEPPRDGGLPRLYAEDASQMVVGYAPGRRQERLAALKMWTDDWTGDLFATLYLPDVLVKLRGEKPAAGSSQLPRWGFRDPELEFEVNPLGAVPVFELMNRPSLRVGHVRSEIADVISDQDRANHIALNALIAAEYGAFRQKWATGLEVPRDEQGRAVEPFDVAVNRILVAEPADARFGDFNATDLKPYIDLYESTVKHMAAVTRTPVSYLLGGMVNISAEALALSIGGLVQKVRRRARHFEQPFEAAMRLAFASIGDPRAEASNAELIWQDPDIRSRAQDVDAAVKLLQVGAVPVQQVREDLGYSDTQLARMRVWDVRERAVRAAMREVDGVAADGGAQGGAGGAPAGDEGGVPGPVA